MKRIRGGGQRGEKTNQVRGERDGGGFSDLTRLKDIDSLKGNGSLIGSR